MADFTAPSWLFPKEGAWESFVKGSQAGAAIAANRIRAQQLYADVRQGQQKIDLAEREQVTREQAADLHNEVVRTKLSNDAADFKTLQEWWPKFKSSDGEVEMPNLHDDNTMLKVAATVADRQSKIGQAEFAKLMSEPGFDLAEPESQKRYFELLSRYKNIPSKLGPDGVMAPIKVAENLKRLRDDADSRIESRIDRSDFNQKKLALQQLLADHTIPLTDARVIKAQQEAAMAEREMAIKEGNLKLRGQEIDRKEKRFNRDAWSREDHAEYSARSKAIQADVEMTTAEKDQAIQETRADIEANRQAREKFKEAKTAREGLKTNTPPVVPPQPIGPKSDAGTNDARALEIRASFKAGKLTKEQALQQLRELGFQ